MSEPTADDVDLADLLPGGKETVPLNKSLDALAGAKGGRSGGGGGSCSLCSLISAHLSYLCWAYPGACGCLACIMMLVCMSVLVTEMINPKQQFGVVQHDWTTVSSIYELDAGKIDHWCLGGGNDGCRCEDPLVPTSRAELRSWTEAYKDNKNLIEKYMDDHLVMADLDVAIVGESAVEEMDGRWLGKHRTDELRNIGTIFKNHFRKDKGAPVEGVALGIAGDSAGNVLWRLIHGEMPNGFEPKIWWVSLGMNDLTRQQCSEEVVVLGVLRVVEEILKRRPRARVVINSLLPMADLRGGTVVDEKAYRDAFSTYRGKRSATTHYVRKEMDGQERFQRVPNPPQGGGRRQRRNKRQLLEAALEAYSAHNNDNCEEIAKLQRKLQQEILGMAAMPEDGSEYDSNDNLVQRKLQEDVPRVARKDKYNPTLNREKHQQKKYNFFRKRRMPLWTSIYAINKQLFKFCEKHPTVDFFDATNIFAERKSDVGQKYFTLLSDNISARGHPTQLGFLKWEDAMVKRIQQILVEMKMDSPDLFLQEPEGPGLGGGSAYKATERIEKKPYVDDDRGEDMVPGGGEHSASANKESSDSDEKRGDNESESDEDGAEAQEEEGEDAEKEREEKEEEEQQSGMQPPQNGMMQQQPQQHGQQPGMMQQQQQPQQFMQQPGMQQGGMMQQQGVQQQYFQQPAMQQNGMMQQPGIQQSGMMQRPGMQQGGMQQQPGLQQGGMTQQPGMQEAGMMQQPGMQQPQQYPQQPGMQHPQQSMQLPGMMQQPGIQQQQYNQEPGLQQHGMMQQNGMNIQQPEEQPEEGMEQAAYPQVQQQQQYQSQNQMKAAPMQGNHQGAEGMQGLQQYPQQEGIQGLQQYLQQPQGMVQGDPNGGSFENAGGGFGDAENREEGDGNDGNSADDMSEVGGNGGNMGLSTEGANGLPSGDSGMLSNPVSGGFGDPNVDANVMQSNPAIGLGDSNGDATGMESNAVSGGLEDTNGMESNPESGGFGDANGIESSPADGGHGDAVEGDLDAGQEEAGGDQGADDNSDATGTEGGVKDGDSNSDSDDDEQ